MALAQERFSSDVDDDGLGPPRRSRPGRARKPTEKEGRLARMVRELRAVEDDIVATLTTTQRHFAQLEARRVHLDAGYTSASEFEERMLAAAPVLRAMREALGPFADVHAPPSTAKREPADARTRQTRALTFVARTLERVRNADRAIHESAAKARAKLCAIEGMRIFEECGYSSFDEFLERALGPSPVLASAVGLVTSEPISADGDLSAQDGGFEAGAPALVDPADVEAVTENETPVEESGAFAPSFFAESSALESTSLFGEPPEAAGGFEDPSPGESPEAASHGSPEEPAPAAAESASPAPAATQGRKRRAGLIVSVVLCVVGIAAGAAAGVWGARASEHASPAAEPAASAAVATQAPEPHEPTKKPALVEKTTTAEKLAAIEKPAVEKATTAEKPATVEKPAVEKATTAEKFAAIAMLATETRTAPEKAMPPEKSTAAPLVPPVHHAHAD